MALEKTYKTGFSTPVTAAALENIRVKMRVKDRDVVTPPSLQSYAFKNSAEFASFLQNETQQIFTTPEFDQTDKTHIYRYNFLASLKKCGGNVDAEYNKDGSVKNAEEHERGKQHRQHYMHGYHVGGEVVTEVHTGTKPLEQDGKQTVVSFKEVVDDVHRGEITREGMAEQLFTTIERAFNHPQGQPNVTDFDKAKDLFAQYAAVCQENLDVNGIQRALAMVQSYFDKAKSTDYTEMQDFCGIAYMAADGALQAVVDAAMHHQGVKVPREIAELPEPDRAQATQTYDNSRDLVFTNIFKKINSKEPISAAAEDDLSVCSRTVKYLNDISDSALVYYRKSQGPEVDGALQLHAGYNIFTDTGEKIVQSNLDNGLSIIFTNVSPVQSAEGQTLAPGQAICATIQTDDSSVRIPEIYAAFLRKHPGMVDKDVGIYITGGKTAIEATERHLKDQSQTRPNEMTALSALLEHLKTHPAAILGSCLFKESQPMSFVCEGGKNGLEFTPGRTREPRKNALAIDFLGMHNLHEGVADVLAAPGMGGKEPQPYIAAPQFRKAYDLSNRSLHHFYVRQVMENADNPTRAAPIVHAHEKAFNDMYVPALQATFYDSVNSYIASEKGNRDMQACRDQIKVERKITFTLPGTDAEVGQEMEARITPAFETMLGNKFGMFIGDAEALNAPLKKAIQNAISFSAKQGKFSIAGGKWDDLEKASKRVEKIGLECSTIDPSQKHKEKSRPGKAAAVS